jgi:hypothetical protein
VIPLRIRYTDRGVPFPLVRAKSASLVEPAVLVLLCLMLIPLLALALSIESYFLAGGSVILFWIALVGTLALGYGALAGMLTAAGKPLPYPRRAVARIRGRLADRLALPRGPT